MKIDKEKILEDISRPGDVAKPREPVFRNLYPEAYLELKEIIKDNHLEHLSFAQQL